VQSRNRIEFLLKLMEANHGAGFVGLIGAHAAEAHCVLDAGGLEGGNQSIGDALTVGQGVVAGWVGRDHDVNRFCASKSLRQRSRVAQLSDKRLCAGGGQGLQTIGAASDHANFLALGEQALGCYVSSVASCSGDDVHDETSCRTFNALFNDSKRERGASKIFLLTLA